jgi:ribonucleoside-diphosphate reductase alpha chain
VQKFCYMRFDPEGITSNPEIPFAKSMPDYIMRWLASRFLDTDVQEELGILTPAVRARQAVQDTAQSVISSDTAGPANSEESHAGGTTSANAPGTSSPSTGTPGRSATHKATAGNGGSDTPKASGGNGGSSAPAASFTDTPPVVPARLQGLDLGPACSQCGGMMQRTGSCYTCSSCGNNTGCG